MGPEDATLMERLEQVEEAARAVASGAWSARRFDEAMATWLALLAEQQALVDRVPPDSSRDDTAERLLGKEGMRLVREGLERMRCYPVDRQAQHLVQGLEQVREGQQRLRNALRMNPEAAALWARWRPSEAGPAPG